MYDLSDVRHIRRIVVGSDNPARLCTQEEIDRRMQELNDCLTGSPKGTLVSVERSFTLVRIGEHQVVLQWIAYHVGFPRRPPPPPPEPRPAPPQAPVPAAPPAPVAEDVPFVDRPDPVD